MKRPCKSCPVKGTFIEENQTCSVPDPADGFPVTCVGEWAQDKHERVRRYVDISRMVRKKFVAGSGGATYLEMFSGPGRSRIMNTNTIIDGSALSASRTAINGGAPFTSVHICDTNSDFLASTKHRLELLGVPVNTYQKPAQEAADSIVKALNPDGLHFAFLDPYNLKALPFSIIEKLEQMRRMDLLIHVSVNDLQRNLMAYIDSKDCPQILNHWLEKIRAINLKPAGVKSIELVSGLKNQPLYWLVFAARHDKANEFWDKIRSIDPQKGFGF
jgi:three-Cys-motif partner protein